MKHAGKVFAIALAATVSLACARHGGPAHGKAGLDRAIGRVASALDCTEAQKADLLERVDRVKAAARGIIGPGAGERRALEERLVAMAGNERMDAAELKRMIEATEARWLPVRDLAIEELVAFHATLDPAQRKKFAERVAALLDAMERRMSTHD